MLRVIVIYIATSDPQSCVNRQRTATLGAVESDEPSLAAATATSQIDISLEYNMKRCIVFNFSKLAILKTQHYVLDVRGCVRRINFKFSFIFALRYKE